MMHYTRGADRPCPVDRPGANAAQQVTRPRTRSLGRVGLRAYCELERRVQRALQRRPRALQATQLVVGDLRFDPVTREVQVGDKRPVLIATELSILEILMRRSPGVVDRRSIAQHVWDNEADAFGSNTIDVHLARLRSKLAGAGIRIETVRGVGYRIIPA